MDKSFAVKTLEKLLNIDKSEIIAFEDNYNDIGMIKYAGLGIAVENAAEVVKKAANHITKSNKENGVAFAINKFVL